MELHLQGLLREMSMRENENGNGQDRNVWPVRLGCMSNSMNEKESEVGWKLPWILRKIQGVPQAKVSHHSSFKSFRFGLALVFMLCLLPSGNSPGQAWSWHKCGNGFQNAVAWTPFANTFFFFSLLEICKAHSQGLPLCSHCNFLSPQYK